MTGKKPRELIVGFANNPLEVIEIQESLGLDPILITMDERWFSMHYFWRLLYGWPDEALDAWRVETKVTARSRGGVDYQFVATTPEGPVTWAYRAGRGQTNQLEPPLKEESDLVLLKYMPDPEQASLKKLTQLVQTVGDRAFFTHNTSGVWGEAVNMRGLSQLSMDLHDRPGFVQRLSEFLTDRAIRRVRHLSSTGVHSILYDQTWVGVGFSPGTYREFMLPYDIQVVQAARDAGLLVSYHNCGRGMRILEEMVSTGAHSLETLTPKSSSGDFDLAEVKRRVGDRITLNGGFDERVLTAGNPAQVREQGRRCLDAAAGGGRYVLRACGQVLDAAPGNIEAFALAAQEFGKY
jgi:uroporphyrinogen-III decarboxylase